MPSARMWLVWLILGCRARTSVVPKVAPRTMTRPDEGWRRAPASARRVVFPPPFGPSSTQCSPRPIARSIGPSTT
jgi:hypothetical protein